MKSEIQLSFVVVLVVSTLLVSCTVARKPQWTVCQPAEEREFWDKKISLALTNVTHEVALDVIEESIKEQANETFTLCYGKLPGSWCNPAGSVTEQSRSRFSFTASNIAIWEALSIIAEVTDTKVMYHKRTAVLAPYIHGSGLVTVFITGQCVDETTGEKIPGFDAATQSEEVIPDEAGNYVLPLAVGGYNNVYHMGEKICHVESHPDEKNIKLFVSAPGYEPKIMTINIQQASTVYTNDIRLKKNEIHDVSPKP